jgi:hypothetical protein
MLNILLEDGDKYFSGGAILHWVLNHHMGFSLSFSSGLDATRMDLYDSHNQTLWAQWLLELGVQIEGYWAVYARNQCVNRRSTVPLVGTLHYPPPRNIFDNGAGVALVSFPEVCELFIQAANSQEVLTSILRCINYNWTYKHGNVHENINFMYFYAGGKFPFCQNKETFLDWLSELLDIPPNECLVYPVGRVFLKMWQSGLYTGGSHAHMTLLQRCRVAVRKTFSSGPNSLYCVNTLTGVPPAVQSYLKLEEIKCASF